MSQNPNQLYISKIPANGSREALDHSFNGNFYNVLEAFRADVQQEAPDSFPSSGPDPEARKVLSLLLKATGINLDRSEP
jgi:hypothetical protein